MECLEQIIGITNTNCPCLQEGLTTDQINELSVSKSGLYLDDLEGGVFLRNVIYLDKCQTFIDIQKKAIQTAIQHFQTDLFAKLNQRFQVKKTAFLGEIGKPAFSGSLDVSKRLQFIRLKPIHDSDGMIHLNRIRIFLNQDTTTTITLIQIKEGETTGTNILQTEVTSVNQVLTLATNVQLPLKKDGRFVEYYLTFERLGDVKPRNLKISCGCSGGDPFAKFVDVTGGETDSFADFKTASGDIWTHGFSLDVNIRCETGQLICREYNDNDAIAKVTAFSILYKAGELVIENILNSGEVNRFTMLSNERLWGKRDHFRKEYRDRIEYLSKVVDVSASDCFICRSDDYFVGHIVN